MVNIFKRKHCNHKRVKVCKWSFVNPNALHTENSKVIVKTKCMICGKKEYIEMPCIEMQEKFYGIDGDYNGK